MLHKLR